MNIDRCIEKMQRIVEKSKPGKITVRLKSGEEIVMGLIDAIDYYCAKEQHDDIVSFTADRAEYDGLAAILTIMCHPVKNRRIEDFE